MIVAEIPISLLVPDVIVKKVLYRFYSIFEFVLLVIWGCIKRNIDLYVFISNAAMCIFIYNR